MIHCQYVSDSFVVKPECEQELISKLGTGDKPKWSSRRVTGPSRLELAILHGFPVRSIRDLLPRPRSSFPSSGRGVNKHHFSTTCKSFTRQGGTAPIKSTRHFFLMKEIFVNLVYHARYDRRKVIKQLVYSNCDVHSDFSWVFKQKYTTNLNLMNCDQFIHVKIALFTEIMETAWWLQLAVLCSYRKLSFFSNFYIQTCCV